MTITKKQLISKIKSAYAGLGETSLDDADKSNDLVHMGNLKHKDKEYEIWAYYSYDDCQLVAIPFIKGTDDIDRTIEQEKGWFDCYDLQEDFTKMFGDSFTPVNLVVD